MHFQHSFHAGKGCSTVAKTYKEKNERDAFGKIVDTEIVTVATIGVAVVAGVAVDAEIDRTGLNWKVVQEEYKQHA